MKKNVGVNGTLLECLYPSTWFGPDKVKGGFVETLTHLLFQAMGAYCLRTNDHHMITSDHVIAKNGSKKIVYDNCHHLVGQLTCLFCKQRLLEFPGKSKSLSEEMSAASVMVYLPFPYFMIATVREKIGRFPRPP